MDIEQVAEETPRRSWFHVDPFEGFQPYQARRLLYGAGVADPGEQKQIAAIVGRLSTPSSAATRCSARSTR